MGHATHQSVLTKLPKIQEVPLEKIRRKETRLSCRDGNSDVPNSQTGKTCDSQGMGQRTQEDLASVLGNTAPHTMCLLLWSPHPDGSGETDSHLDLTSSSDLK